MSKGEQALRFLEEKEGEDEDQDVVRVSFGLVDGEPVLKALDELGEVVFEER